MDSRIRHAMRRASLQHIRFVAPIAPDAAPPAVAAVYEQIEADFGMLAPPIALHAPAPDTLAASWLILREALLVEALSSRTDKEAVAAAVSSANACPYCLDVHGTALVGLHGGPDAAAVAAGRLAVVSTPRLAPLVAWAAASGDAAAARRPVPPFTPAQAPELIGVAVVFHYLNRMVNVFLKGSPFPITHGLGHRLARRGAARLLARMSRPVPAGQSLALLPAAPVPAELFWTAGAPHLAEAFARALAAFDRAGTRAVPARVRALVLDAGSDAARPPADLAGGSRWIDERVAALPADERQAGRFALLVRFASYRVPDALVREFIARHDDATAVALAAWASMAAAGRIGYALGQDVLAASGRNADAPATLPVQRRQSPA